MFNRALVTLLPLMPRPVVWRFSKRYIAGKSLAEALDCVQALNEAGICATLDVLGEDTTEASAAKQSRDLYLAALDGIQQRQLDCNISIKLSQMGLRFDPSLCESIARDLAAAVDPIENFLRIDMEDSSVTDVTLGIYRSLRQEFPRLGTVIQACLRRSKSDVEALMREGPTNLRVCKGIYIEPPEVAFQGREEVRRSFNELLVTLFEGGAERVAIASHDPPLIDAACALIRREGIDPSRFEFQMLLGVAEKLRDRLVRDGYRMRVYVPFGEAWFAYSYRRLRENPQIAGHIIRNLFSG